MATPKDQALNGVVVGLKALTGEVKPRLDIDVLLTQHPDTFNLMLQAMSLIQKDPKKLGFYALSGSYNSTQCWSSVLIMEQESTVFPLKHGMMCTTTSAGGSVDTVHMAS